MKPKTVKIAFVMMLLLAMSGCASMKMTVVWKDPGYQGGPVESVLVVGVARDEARRRLFETEMAIAFTRNGVRAIRSIDVISQGQPISRESVRSSAARHKVTTVFVARVLEVRSREVEHPPVYMEKQSPDGRTMTDFDTVLIEGSNSREYSGRLESRLYAFPAETLIWKGLSETVASGSVDTIIGTAADLVMESLKNNQLIE